VFEAEWNRYPDLPAVQVINLGFPGTNSSRVRNIVGPVLRELEPTAVIVMIGANDFWTVPEPPVDPAVEGEDGRGSVARTLWRVSRVYRLLFMLRQAMTARTVEVDWTSSAALPSHPGEPVPDSARGSARVGDVDIELGWKKLPESSEGNPSFAATLRQNLTKIVAEIRRSGAEPILLTYPSSLGIYTVPSRVIRETADALGCEIIDLAVVFAYLCPGTECAYFFPDGHPTAAGHAHIGRILARKLRDVRRQRHGETTDPTR
jgi:lysophospholipase L1-like esterase